jgi:hypothetical protein
VAEIWRTQDRLERDVVFTSESRDHILDEHDDMADRLDEIQAVVERATVVARDLDYRRRENHYRRMEFGRNWIKVVVQYRPVPPQGTWEGEIITAYQVRRPDPREEQRTL